MSDGNWSSVHVFYHEGQDALIDGAIRPLVDELVSSGLIDGHFFVRHWQGGPHVRLRILPRADAEYATVFGRVESHINGFLESHPSRTTLGEDGYTRLAGPLLAMEGGQSTLAPLEPNNSLRHVPYEPEYGRYGGTVESMTAVERHFTESSGIALDVLGSGRERDHCSGQALAMMLLCAAVCEESSAGLLRFCGAGRNDWGRHLVPGGTHRPEAAFEKRFQRQRERLHDQVARLREIARREEVAEVDASLGRWLRSVRSLKEDLVRLEREGLFQPREFPLSGDRHADEHPGLRSVLLFCAHMNNNRMGISLTEESYLMYLLWRTVSETVEETTR